MQGAMCYCNFCKPIPHLLFGRLGLPGFLTVLIIGVGLLALLACLIKRANKLTVLHIPFAELHLNDESEVLGEGLYGKVLRGEYRGTQIAVKRMLPPRSSRYLSPALVVRLCLSVCVQHTSLHFTPPHHTPLPPAVRFSPLPSAHLKPHIPCRTKSIFDVDIIRPSRQSQEEVLNMQDSQRLTNDLVIDIMADSVEPPTASGKSVIYTPGQQLLLPPGMGPDPNKVLAPIQSAESETSVMRTSQSMASESALAVDKEQQDELLLGASVPTTENLAQLQQHQSAAEEDLIRAHPAESPRSTFWGEESRYACKPSA